MKSKWPEVFLGDIADLTVGFVGTMSDYYVESGVPFLRSLNIRPYEISYNDIKYITSEFSARIKKSELSAGDVVIVRTGKPGTCAVVPEELTNANCSDLVIVRPHTERIDSVFLAAYINSMASSQINANLVGAVQQHFNVSSAKKITIPLPPLGYQKLIAEKVNALNNKIKINQQELTLLNSIIQAIYKRWFIEDVKPAWQRSNVFDCVKEISIKNRDKADYSVLSVVKEGEFKASEDVFTKQVYSKDTSNYKIVRRNQVAYNPARANIGSIAMLKEYDEGLVSPIYVVFEMKDMITSTFFYYYMKEPMFIENIRHHSIGTTRQNFPFEAFKLFDLIVPPMELQLKYEQIARPIEHKLAKLKEENEVLTEIRETILPKLISGEVLVEVD